METNIFGTGVHMAEQGLDIFDANPALKQVAGKAVAARMGRNTACDAAFLALALKNWLTLEISRQFPVHELGKRTPFGLPH